MYVLTIEVLIYYTTDAGTIMEKENVALLAMGLNWDLQY